MTTTEGLARPWGLIEARLGRVQVRARVLSFLYLASGSREGPGR